MLREKNNLTQAELSKKLGITRSGVNAWEMGISVPSTQYIVELSKLFNVSTDYLLGLTTNNSIDLTGLSEEDKKVIYELTIHLRKRN